VNNKVFFCSTYLITERQWNTYKKTDKATSQSQCNKKT